MTRMEWTPDLLARLPSWRGDGPDVSASAVAPKGKVDATSTKEWFKAKPDQRATVAFAMVDRWVGAFGTAGTVALLPELDLGKVGYQRRRARSASRAATRARASCLSTRGVMTSSWKEWAEPVPFRRRSASSIGASASFVLPFDPAEYPC